MYPSFTLPAGLPPGPERTKSQAKDYFAWFTSLMPERFAIVESAVAKSPEGMGWRADFTPESLHQLGTWLALNVEVVTRDVSKTAPCQSPAGASAWELTGETFIKCFDVGVYFGQTLVNNNPRFVWFLNLDVPKSLVDYGQPVVKGLGSVRCNPVQLMVTLAYGFAKKSKQPARLYELYRIWKGMLAQGRFSPKS